MGKAKYEIMKIHQIAFSLMRLDCVWSEVRVFSNGVFIKVLNPFTQAPPS